MSLQIKILKGPRKNQCFKISEGHTIGRKKADINLDDPKASNIHAQIKASPRGLLLIDNDSRNGIYFENKKVRELPLLAGAIFRIGASELLIVETEGTTNSLKSVEKPEEILSWQAKLLKINKAVLAKIQKVTPIQTLPLTPVLKLVFLQGRQLGTEWVLGYAPRKVGSHCIEFPVFEEGAPPVCFEILPSDSGPKFYTTEPEVVRLNGTKTKSDDLKTGDLITIGKTVLQVDLINV